MADGVALAEFKQGMRLLRDGKPMDALIQFQSASGMEKQNPYYMSFVGVALVRAERNPKTWPEAARLCETALSLKRNEVQLHLNLAEVYVSTERKEEAVAVLNRATASFGRHAGVRRALRRLGDRRPPVLSFLDRQNVLNKHLGMLRHRVRDWAEDVRVPLLHSS
jgi:Flp pilus assembly protein TadD